MPKRLLAHIASIFAVVCVQPTMAQNTDLSIEWFGGAGGVEFGGGAAVFQDRFGFMWFGTNGGLYKYDGYDVEFFAHDPDDSTSISNPRIESLYEDRNGVLWIGTSGNGFNRYNRATNTFTRYVHDEADPTSISPGMVAAFLEDRSGVFWIGTSRGVVQFDAQAGTFLHYVHPTKDPPELHESRVKVIMEDQYGRLWFATNELNPNGIFRYDPSSESFAHYKHDPEDHTSLYANRVNGVYEDSRGDIWVTTLGGVLHNMIPELTRSNGIFWTRKTLIVQPFQYIRLLYHLLDIVIMLLII